MIKRHWKILIFCASLVMMILLQFCPYGPDPYASEADIIKNGRYVPIERGNK